MSNFLPCTFKKWCNEYEFIKLDDLEDKIKLLNKNDTYNKKS